MSMTATDMTAIDPVEQRLLERWPEVRKIFFRNLTLDMHMGVHDNERGRTQPVRINVVLYMRRDTAPESDAIAGAFNYDRIREAILPLASARHINLQETLVGEIMAACLGFEEVLAARVSTEKTDIYPDCDGVGYELVRIRDG